MQIAEDLVKSGMTTGGKFNQELTRFVREMNFTRVIETGTYHGTGSTTAILNGLSPQAEFISIEVDPENYLIAKKNLRGKNIKLINGLSIGRNQLPVTISEDFPDFVVVDHQPSDRMDLYLKEVSHNVADHALGTALKQFDNQPDFVLLDSAGYMGFQEFTYLISRVQTSFYLALDDTDHIKHFTTMEFIRERPEKFRVIWEVKGESNHTTNGNQRDKFGSAIIAIS